MPWSDILEFTKEFGLVNGGFAVFFFLAHIWIFRLYSARVADRQTEIDRLADDNREYRERFLKILDAQMGYEKPAPPALPKPQSEKKKKGDR